MFEKLYQEIIDFVKQNNIPVKVHKRPPTYYCNDDLAMFADIAIEKETLSNNTGLPDIAILQNRGQRVSEFMVRVWRENYTFVQVWLLDSKEEMVEIINSSGKTLYTFKDAVRTLLIMK